ncbi:MAG: hypothetical protein H6799_03670 [Candidatus Nomurabacteria bacterium]|nr:MAG: hypothetical protein H6799_03670 [Candidatus Nomurabacteria bacterium]
MGSGSFEIAGDVTSSAKTTLGINGPGSFQQVSLVPNMSYYDNSAQAKLTFRVFNTREDLNSAFNNGSIEMYIGSGNQINKNEDSEEAEIKLSSGVFSFFNLKSPYLSDIKLRRALSGYINRKSLSILNSGVKPLYSPILEVGDTEQPVINIEEAKKLIAEAGYTLDTNSNQFIKDGQPLRLNLVTGDSDEYSRVVDELAKTWKEIGVSLEIIKAKSSDLQSNYFVNKGYDILVYGISLNQATEPYAYWSSDAANPKGLNFSNYKSPANDADLDVARSKLNPAERNVRLERFVKRWKEDVPAAALYVPSLKVMYRSGSVQPDVNQQTYVSGFTDAFDLFNQIKGQKKKLYQN